MKKYKLIKEYPGSPKLNTVIILTVINKSGGHYLRTFTIYGGDPNCDNSVFKIADPANYPEFWEGVKEKDYEILAFINIQAESIGTKRVSGGFSFDSDRTSIKSFHKEDFFLKNFGLYRIHSVKRLSDGEIFAIGDKTEDGVINEIKLDLGGIVIKTPVLNIGHTYTHLKHCKKSKKPFFTTEDGVDIFHNDIYYTLGTFNWFITKCQAIVKTNYNYHYKLFSTEEAAKEYTLLNKPCLSINEVLNSMDGLVFAESKLKELVKSKL